VNQLFLPSHLNPCIYYSFHNTLLYLRQCMFFLSNKSIN
jgi:hypothetical protein